MKHLYYVRHGISEANKAGQWSGSTNSPLSEEGRLQAKLAGEKAKKQGLVFDIIISSPMDRTLHTAQHIATEIGYPHTEILLHPLLKERHFGVLEGTVNTEAGALYAQGEVMIDGYEGIERLIDLQWRTKELLAYIKTLEHESILLVGHGSYARSLVRSINGQPITIQVPPLPHAEIIKLL